MKKRLKLTIIQLILFFVSLHFTFLISGSIIHEASHALMCALYGFPFTYTLWSVTYNSTNASPIAQTTIALAGGIGQAILSLLLLGSNFLRKKKQQVVLCCYSFRNVFSYSCNNGFYYFCLGRILF